MKREEVPTMRHVSRTHRVALDWLFDRINLDPKIQIKYIDTKNQLADMLTKGNFTRDEWNHFLCLFNISHFSSTVCSEGMAKRCNKKGHSEVEANDEPYCKGSPQLCHLRRQKARGRKDESQSPWKSRPMMSLVARAPSTLSSSASESPGKKSS